MSVTLLHAADIHLGALRRIQEIPMIAKMERYQGILQFLFVTARKRKVDHLVMAGDIFHDRDTPPQIKDMFLQALLHYNDVPVALIPGNHDTIEHGYTSLHAIHLLQEKGKLGHVVFAETASRVVETDNLWFVLVPPQDDTKQYPAHVRELVASVPKTSKSIVVVSHESVAGIVDDSGYRTTKGVKIPRLKRVRYWAMGDVHTCQMVEGNRHIRYPGPPAQTKFNELPDRGALLVDLGDSQGTVDASQILNTHPKVRTLVTIDSDDPKDLAKIAPDAWVSLKTSSVDTMRLSSPNVVKVTPRKHKDSRMSIDVSDPLAGLCAYLESKAGFSTKDSVDALELAKRLTE